MSDSPADYPDALPSRLEPTPDSSAPTGNPSPVGVSFGIPDVTLETIYRAIAVGMAPYQAMLLAELTDAQIKALDENAEFNKRIRFHQQKKIYDTLVNVDTAMTVNTRIGNSTEARWLLSKLDRNRFGNGILDPGGSEDLPPASFTERDA